MRLLNGLTFFTTAWGFAAAGLSQGVDWALIVAGALLVVAAMLAATRRTDLLNRLFDALPNSGWTYGGVPRGLPRRIFIAVVLAALGLGIVIEGVTRVAG